MMLQCTRTRTKFLRRMVLLVPSLLLATQAWYNVLEHSGGRRGCMARGHMNTWMYQSLADEAVGAIPLDARSKNMKQLCKEAVR